MISNIQLFFRKIYIKASFISLTNLNLKRIIIIEINHHSNKQNYYIDRLKITFRKKKEREREKVVKFNPKFPLIITTYGDIQQI